MKTFQQFIDESYGAATDAGNFSREAIRKRNDIRNIRPRSGDINKGRPLVGSSARAEAKRLGRELGAYMTLDKAPSFNIKDRRGVAYPYQRFEVPKPGDKKRI